MQSGSADLETESDDELPFPNAMSAQTSPQRAQVSKRISAKAAQVRKRARMHEAGAENVEIMRMFISSLSEEWYLAHSSWCIFRASTICLLVLVVHAHRAAYGSAVMEELLAVAAVMVTATSSHRFRCCISRGGATHPGRCLRTRQAL